MNRKLVLAGAVVSALAIGGTALAGGTGEKGHQKMEPQHEAQPGKATHQEAKPAEQKKATEAFRPKKNQLLAKAVRLTSLDANQVKQLQAMLQSVGLYHGKLDGILGPMTRVGMSRYFQSELALMQKGRIAEHTLSTFGFDEGEIERVRGVDRKVERQPTRGYEHKGTQKKMEQSTHEEEQQQEQQQQEQQ